MEDLAAHAPLIAAGLAGAGALFALLACVAALLAARAARRGAATASAEITAQLEETTARLQLALAAGRGDDPVATLGAMRDEMSAIADQVSALSTAQLELNKVVGRAVKGALTETEERLAATLTDAAVMQAERLDALDAALTAATGRVEENLANVLVVLGDGLAGENGASAAALAADGIGDSLATLAAQVEGLRADLAAAEDRLSAAMGRAPSIFDAGRVVSVVAPPPPEEPAVAAE